MRRFFVDRETILSDTPVLKGPDVRHIQRVLRLQPGDEIFVFDGHSDYRAQISGITPQALTFSILERFDSIAESTARITLGQALIKSGKMDQIVRHITELGIYAFVPFMVERSVPKSIPQRWETRIRRWETIARESLKQCGRSEMPRIHRPVSFESLLESPQAYDAKIIFHPHSPKIDALPRLNCADKNPILIALVGPEGGFTEKEIQLSVEHGFVPHSLGPRILEADTAAVSACAILQYALGDMDRRGKKP